MQPKQELKVLGRRKPPRGGLEEANGFLKLVIALRGDKPFVPRGVYCFKSHEELDEWTMKMLTRPSADRQS